MQMLFNCSKTAMKIAKIPSLGKAGKPNIILVSSKPLITSVRLAQISSNNIYLMKMNV